ncbi:hypothetical protein F8388_011647 [Cannabis sativa]|uniref:RNase H type-1 domain-containing protein n=1 Tax=Cannabis sativa TaxID=3483 RepID=A0A7J6GZE3_CANSA|nr:hypothetical protein F8388_011647 [Cannabis sativa]
MVLLILEIDLILGNYYPGLGCLAFLFLGNFNDFLTWEDKSSSNLGNGPSPLFCTFLNKFHLQALHPNGPRLTWTNTAKAIEKLWNALTGLKKDKRFLFENVWLSEPQWNDVLLEAWSSNTPSNDPSTNLLLKQSTTMKKAWSVWNVRNAAVFRNQDSNPTQGQADDTAPIYHRPKPLAWEAPPVGTLKLNMDAAVSSHKNKIRGGVLVRDHTGNRMGQMQPQAAEGWVLWEGLKWSRDNGINIHHIEVDCKNLLTDLQSTDENLSSYGTIINVIRRMLSSLPLYSSPHSTAREYSSS